MNIFDQILAFLQNQQFALMGAMIMPFIFKYFPKFKDFSNELCTFLAALTAFCVNVFAPQPAAAGFFGDVFHTMTPVAAVFIGVIDAGITKWVHDHVFNPAYKALGLKKPA